jgi:ribosomal protein L17
MMNLVNSIKTKKAKLEKEVPLIDEAKRNSVAAYRILFKQLREKMKIEKEQLVSDIKSNVHDYKKHIDEENQLIREII